MTSFFRTLFPNSDGLKLIAFCRSEFAYIINLYNFFSFLKSSLAERSNQPYDISELSTQESPSKSFTMTSRSIIHKESRDDIEKRGGYERPQYRGGIVVNRDHLKDQFVNKLAFGMEDPVREYRKMKAKEQQAPKQEPKDRFIELENEIKDREEFLASMEKIGQGKKSSKSKINNFKFRAEI